MAKAIAIAMPQESFFHAALASIKNSAWLVLEFMYGTPERTRFTLAFAFALTVLGMAMSTADVAASAICVHDTLSSL